MSVYFDRKSAGRLRKQRQHQGRIKAVLLLAMILAAVLAAIYGLNYCRKKGAFNIREVRLSGNKMADIEGLTSIAEAFKGRPFWRPRTREISAAICRKYPAVKKVSVTVWPWGAADVQITERKPLARLQDDLSRMIDAEGAIFGPSGQVEVGEGLPQIKIKDAEREAVWRALRLTESAPWVEKDWLIDAGDRNDIRLLLPGGVTVHFGNGSFPAGWQKLSEVLEVLNKDQLTASEIDLRFNGQAVVTGQTLVQKGP